MMLQLRFFTCVGFMAALITSAQTAAVFERQVGATNLPSTLTPGAQGTATHQTLPPLTTVTEIVVITSTLSSSSPPVFTAPVVSSTLVLAEVHSGHTSFSTVIITSKPDPLTAIPHPISPPSLPTATQSAETHNPGNKGAIAGGVLGALAVIVAAFAAFIWLKRRSPTHWRNRTAGRWQSLDNKDAGSAGARPIYVGEPIPIGHHDAKQHNPDPLPALYIRDRNPAMVNPFEKDAHAPGSPASPRGRARGGSYSTKDHRRVESSSGHFDIELRSTST